MRGTPAPGSVGAIAFMWSPHCWQYAKPSGVAVPQRGHVIVLPCADTRGDGAIPWSGVGALAGVIGVGGIGAGVANGGGLGGGAIIGAPNAGAPGVVAGRA